MQPDELHWQDGCRLRILGERLCDVSIGDFVVERTELRALVAELMVCTSPTCSDAGADAVADRLFAIADWRLGRDGMAEAALVDIAPEQASR